MRGRAHSEELRAEIKAALLAGLGVTECAQKYSLPKQTISRIKNELLPEQLGQVGTEKQERLDDLLLDALAANLKAQKRIVETASEPDYIRKQPATAVADLYKEFADKAVRLLEAASFGSEGEESEPTAADSESGGS